MKKIQRILTKRRLLAHALTLAGLASSSAVLAQESDMHSGHDMAAMQNTPKAMDHSNMAGMDHGSMNSKMQPQGGDAPKDARDPHAYSNGYTLTAGPYAPVPYTHLTLPTKRIG